MIKNISNILNNNKLYIQNKQTRARIKINNLIYHRIKQYSFKEITVFNKLFY